MRKLMRRLTLFPLVLIGSPLVYFIGWCLEGHKESVETTRELLQDFWYGMEE